MVLVGVPMTAAQEPTAGGFDLNAMRAAPAGDAFFGVASPYAAGHLVPAGYVMFDHAARPIRLAATDTSVVSAQSYLRADASLALFHRLLVSVQAPVMVAQSGARPAVAGAVLTELDAPRFGDARVGLRGRVFGEDGGPFQVGAGGYLHLPTGDPLQYAGSDAVRGDLHLAVGGRLGATEGGVGFVYAANVGPELRAGDTAPQVLRYGVGAALLLAGDLVQVGPELWGTSPVGGGELSLSSSPVVTAAAGTQIEVLGGAKVRLFDGLTLGAAVGPGLSTSVGTPTWRALGFVGWSPLPRVATLDEIEPDEGLGDRDDDGIPDELDACPGEAGEPSADPTRDGCPVSDGDGDGVQDADDACPSTPGVPNVDLTKNGCPLDSDEDGIHDGIDACPTVAGVATTDAATHGCPADRDGDGVVDARDACPDVVGDPADDPAQNGCPRDPDGDGIVYGADACPRDAGVANPDPERNGCPEFVRVTDDEILINQRIEFDTYGDRVREAVTPDSESVLAEVAAAIRNRPEVTRVEVQGHTDDTGDAEFNDALSQRRADAVRTWLIDRGGIRPERLVAKGYGFRRPLADNRVRTGRAKNRRVQFVIVARRP
ncbi:MAG: OmpA family protein [Myxococcota bacterium]